MYVFARKAILTSLIVNIDSGTIAAMFAVLGQWRRRESAFCKERKVEGHSCPLAIGGSADRGMSRLRTCRRRIGAIPTIGQDRDRDGFRSRR